jgi:anti-anti-sigma factor
MVVALSDAEPVFGRLICRDGTMDIDERRVRNVLIVGMTGMLDTQTARDAEPRLLNMIKDDDRRVLLNLGKLTYVSSMGLRLILQAAKLLNARTGELRICNASDDVKNVLKISGFHNMIKLYETEAEAFAAPWQYR